jgi:hypothetical protein
MRTETSECVIPGSGKAPDLVRASSLSDGQKKTGQIIKKKKHQNFLEKWARTWFSGFGFLSYLPEY